jgi:hypothetical protein
MYSGQAQITDTNRFVKQDGPLRKGNETILQVIDTPQVCLIVEQMPKFNGDLNDYVCGYLDYSPTKAQAFRGTVALSFIVERDGSLSRIQANKHGNSQYADSAVIRLFQNMPKWQPGRHRGHLMRVVINIQIHIDPTYIEQNSANPNTPTTVK